MTLQTNSDCISVWLELCSTIATHKFEREADKLLFRCSFNNLNMLIWQLVRNEGILETNDISNGPTRKYNSC